MNLRERIETITLDDLIKFEIEEDFEETTGTKPNEFHKQMIRENWNDEIALEHIKKYIIEKVL